MYKKRILIVEDDEIMANLEMEILEANGFDVDIAGDAVDGLQRIRSDGYDAIISDFSMPRMRGDEFYQEVKRLGKDLEKRIIFISAAINYFIKSTGNRFLKKPFTLEQLVKTIEDFMKLSREEVT